MLTYEPIFKYKIKKEHPEIFLSMLPFFSNYLYFPNAVGTFKTCRMVFAHPFIPSIVKSKKYPKSLVIYIGCEKYTRSDAISNAFKSL